jgi:hypothetical protein
VVEARNTYYCEPYQCTNDSDCMEKFMLPVCINYCINIVSIYLNILILYNLNVYKIFKQTKFKFKFIIHSQLITPTEQINNLKEYFSESGYVQNLN